MATLGHQTTGLGAVRERVAFEDDDSIEPVCENAGGAEPRHAGTEHDCGPPDFSTFLSITSLAACHGCASETRCSKGRAGRTSQHP